MPRNIKTDRKNARRRVRRQSALWRRTRNWVLVVVGAALVVYGLRTLSGSGGRANSVVRAAEAVVYYEPSCGCCVLHATYLRNAGFEVTIESERSMDEVKREYGIPYGARSCHTTIIDGYVVEGHMPLQAIDRLLEERPSVRGIALPDMPSGSPGMPGFKTETWIILTLEEDGSTNVFMEM
jgi:hypothetical protein